MTREVSYFDESFETGLKPNTIRRLGANWVYSSKRTGLITNGCFFSVKRYLREAYGQDNVGRLKASSHWTATVWNGLYIRANMSYSSWWLSNSSVFKLE